MRVWGVEHRGERYGLAFDCPGCKLTHVVHIVGPTTWDWNGSIDRPTFSPSLLVTCLWGEEAREIRCHSFVRDGRIEFLSDCTHELAGQTVELPELEVEVTL